MGILMFGGILYFARTLDATQMGIFFLFFAVQGLLSIPADLGLRSALEKRLSEGGDLDEILGSALALKLGLLAVVGTVIFLAQGPINRYFGANLAMFLIITVILRELSLFYIHAVRGELRVGETAPIEFTRRLTWVGIGAYLVSTGYGVEGIVMALICSSLVSLMWAYTKCNVGIGRPSRGHIESLFAFSKYDTVNSIGGHVYQWMDTAIIGFFLASSFVSAYEIAWQVTLLVLMLSNSISLTLFPQISQWNASASTNQIESTISTAIGFATFISIPAIVGSAIYATEILRYTFGPEYTIAATVLVVLMVEKLFQSFNDIIGISVRAIDRPDLAARATVVSIGINLVLSPVLLLSIGLVGAALATLLSWLVNTLLHLRYLKQHVTVQIPFRLVGWYALSSVLMGITLAAVKSAVPVDGILILLVQIALGAALYVGFSTVIPEVRNRIIIPSVRMFDLPVGR